MIRDGSTPPFDMEINMSDEQISLPVHGVVDGVGQTTLESHPTTSLGGWLADTDHMNNLSVLADELEEGIHILKLRSHL